MPATKLLSLFLSFCLILEQTVLAQSIDLSHYFANSGKTILQGDKFRPLHLRYISYDTETNDFQILLDKGDAVGNGLKPFPTLEDETQELMKYFFIGLSLPNEKFWVNLRPDSPDNILDPVLEKTDIGRIFLEADLQLKKDTSGMTSPQTPKGKEYWDKLYKKAGELFGSQNITIPTITRPWIVPGETIIGESSEGAYIYKATLKVMLESDYLIGRGGSRTAPTSDQYSFSDPRLKELNEYSTRLIKETIIPKLTYEVNTSKRYAQLRQVYYSLILAQWFKQKYERLGNTSAPGIRASVNSYIDLIDSGNLANIASREPYDKQAYFRQYQKSFQDGEYSLQEPVYTPTGQSIRRYMSGGLQLNSSPITRIETGKSINIRPYLISVGSPITDAFMKKQAEILFQSLLSLHKEIMKASPEHRNTILEGWSFRIKDAIADAAGLSREEKVLLGKIIHDATPSAHKHEFATLAKSRGKERIRLVMDIVEEAQKNIQNSNIFGNDEKNTIQEIFRKVYDLSSSSIDINQRLLASSSAAAQTDRSQITGVHTDELNRVLKKITKRNDELDALPEKAREDNMYAHWLSDYLLRLELLSALLPEGIKTIFYSLLGNDFWPALFWNVIGTNQKAHGGAMPIMSDAMAERRLRESQEAINSAGLNNRKIKPVKIFNVDNFDYAKYFSDIKNVDALFIKGLSKYTKEYQDHSMAIKTALAGKPVDDYAQVIKDKIKEFISRINNDIIKDGKYIIIANEQDMWIGDFIKKAFGYIDLLNQPSYADIKTALDKYNLTITTYKDGEVDTLGGYLSIRILQKPFSSAMDSEKGGIDFHALPIETRQIDSLQSLADSPLAVNPDLDFEGEWRGIQMVFNAGIRPSARRMAEFAVSASASPLNSRRLEDLRGLVTDLLRRDEEDEKPAPEDPVLKELLAIL